MPNFTDAVNTGAKQIAYMQGVAQANNAWSASQAQIQREWQEQQNAKAMAFNQNEAAINRNWQEMLSNTAHQREVRDLMAAGLNPVLSAMNGNGASVGSGATASGVTSQGAKGDTDTSVNGAIANLLGSILSAQTQIAAANVNARTQEAVADKYTAMEKIVSEISASASRYASDQSASASRYHADKAAAASMFGSLQAASASRYASDQAYLASKYGSDMRYKELEDFGRGEYTSVFGMLMNRLPEILGALKGFGKGSGGDKNSGANIPPSARFFGSLFG